MHAPLPDSARAVLGGVLLADGPRPELADKLALFGQFVGSWDLEVIGYPAEAPPRRASGEWHFGWALDGRAVIDVWISPRRSDRTGRESEGDHGATLRFYDSTIDAWRSTWIGPVRNIVRPFIARQIGDEIVLSGSFTTGVETRWIFSQITPISFHWRSIESSDGWLTQRLWQEMNATRQPEHDA